MKKKILKTENLLTPYECRALVIKNKVLYFVEFRTKNEKIIFQIFEN